MEASIKKVTISLHADLVDYADALARNRGTTRSAVIQDLLAERRTWERDALACEGYRYYAAESSEFDSASGPAVAEAWSDDRPER